ncbi:MAG: ATP-dependent sacrificial sulfur transferase LarE [Gemmatimonadota bacterium]|jgi:uncharacterized protein
MTVSLPPDAPPGLAARLDRLRAILEELGSLCIGYSGGVDSVFLARVAIDVLGRDRVLAVTGRSDAYPAVQHEMALRCVREFEIPHLEIGTAELEDPRYTSNPVNRCYFCKTELWGRLGGIARERGLAHVADGSNADDAHDFRPGMTAAEEHAVRSPLLEAGLTKADIRAASVAMRLPTWDQPSSPCLSSRLPYGVAVTRERLRQVEQAEALLRGRGFREFRVRHHGDVARIEVAPGEMVRALSQAESLDRALRALGFDAVLLDVNGYRRGALNEGLTVLETSPDS